MPLGQDSTTWSEMLLGNPDAAGHLLPPLAASTSGMFVRGWQRAARKRAFARRGVLDAHEKSIDTLQIE